MRLVRATICDGKTILKNRMHTWTDAANKWLEETAHKKTHKHDKSKLDWIAERWRDKCLKDITRQVVQDLASQKLLTAKPATANRYLALIRAILRRSAFEWDWLEKPPHIRLYHEPRRRVRWLKPDEARRLLDEIPEHHRDAMIFSLSTGLRASNVSGLKWAQVDLKRRVLWLYADQTKNGEDLHVSLNDAAMAVLHARRYINSEYVFTYQGKPLKRFTTRAWYKALGRANLDDFRWHDLRHTWASWLVQEGVTLYALQEMGGWKTASMVRRYAHLSPAHNLTHAQKIDATLNFVAGFENED